MNPLAFGLRRNQLPKGAGRLIENRHLLSAHQFVELFRTANNVFGHYKQTPSIEQRSPYLPYRKIEGVRMEKSPDIISAKLKPPIGSGEQASHIPKLHHHPFGHPGG